MLLMTNLVKYGFQIKHKFKFKCVQHNYGITININVSGKNVIYVEKIVFGILLHGSCGNGRYSGSIMDDSGIMCGEIIES